MSLSAEVKKIIRLEGIPSASALARIGGSLLVACDDSPWMFRIDEAGRVLERIRVFEGEEMRIPKAEKPDLESMAVLGNEDGILLFGSGSKLPRRAGIVHWPTSGQPKYHAAEGFYRAVIELCNITEESLNIEGAACDGWQLYLLNRGGNHLITLNAAELLRHLQGEGPLPEMGVFAYDLPHEEGYIAGFSGATILPDKTLVFSASVEATANWIDDGEVLGSYIGFLNPRDPEAKYACIPVTQDGKRYKGKIEAVEIKRTTGLSDDFEVWAVTDDDAGNSDLLSIHISR